MKPRALVRESARWRVWRTTTDRPAEIREALTARGIDEVYKGDQNQAWDAVLSNHCLLRAVGDTVDVCLFVQDEKLGTPDAYLARYWRALPDNERPTYALTEDYYRARKGAVWEHQDVSYGLFFTEAVSPEQFAAVAVHLHRAAALWEEHGQDLMAASEFLDVMESLGVSFRVDRAAASTGLGTPVNLAGLASVFQEFPQTQLYYALTRTLGLYGVVPTRDEDMTLSSIPAGHPELRALGRELLVRFAARGAMRAAGSRAARREVGRRAREVAGWVASILQADPQASVADLQAQLGQRLIEATFPEDRFALTRTSTFVQVDCAQLDRLAEPEETLFYVLDLALRHPAEFTESYNEALNRAGFGLQRVKYDAANRIYQPPFFVEFAPDGQGTAAYRYSLRLEGEGLSRIVLSNQATGVVTFAAQGPVDSARALCSTLCQELRDHLPVVVVGKAAAFAAELRRWPRALGLPRQGSKYAPMVEYLLEGLRERGVMGRNEGLLIRIGLNALDRLAALGDRPLRMPRFLEPAFGRATSTAQLAAGWRSVAQEARETLELLAEVEFGQHVHLVRLLAAGSQGHDLAAVASEQPRLRRLLERVGSSPERRARLERLGADLPRRVGNHLDRLLAQRDALLKRRRDLRETVPAALERERAGVELEMLLVYAAWVRRLWQQAESLHYLNDRPYSLALYLLFGPEYFRVLCRNVEFDLEATAEREAVPCG